MLQNCLSVFILTENILIWFLLIKRATIAQILFGIDFCDKFSVFDYFKNFNKAYKVCLKEVTIVANSIASVA